MTALGRRVSPTKVFFVLPFVTGMRLGLSELLLNLVIGLAVGDLGL